MPMLSASEKMSILFVLGLRFQFFFSANLDQQPLVAILFHKTPLLVITGNTFHFLGLFLKKTS
jgi:hypothetical protein